MYYLKSDFYNGKHEIWKENYVNRGDMYVDGLIATFTCLIHAEIALETFNNTNN